MLNKKCYLAGPMTGIPGFNFPAFFAAEADLRALGFEVFNPARADTERYGVDLGKSATGSHEEAEKIAGRPVTYKECLKVDLNWILDNADAIALLPGWEKSMGVKAEKALADCLQLEVINL